MKKIVVLLTACLLLLGAAVSVAAQVAEPAAVLDNDALDYRETPKKTAASSMGDVLDSIEGVTVSDAEKAYFRYEFNGQSVLYYTKPALINRQYEYDGVHQYLTVTVKQDSYEPQKHDTVVVWIPTTATVGASTAEFVPAPDLGEGYYRAVIENVSPTAEVTAMVEYRAELDVPAEALNEYINHAYEQALLLHDEFTTLEERRAAYQTALQAYEQSRLEWDKYDSDSDQYELHQAKAAKYQDYLAYQAYLVRLGEYQIAHEKYLKNQQEWATYEQQTEKYQQYLNYKNIEYPKLTDQYQKDLNTVQNQLALLALLEKQDPNTGLSFIDVMVDDRVATMIAEKRTLVSSLVGDGPVDAVIESTKALQYFCKTYKSLPTDQEKYAFYIKEYNKVKVVPGGTVNDSLVKHLRQLYTNIKTIYETKAIYTELQKDYPEHIARLVRMLGLLYVQRCVFDDTVTLNLNEVVDTRGNQKASALVHASVRPASDTNKATPFSVWPAAPAKPETFEVTKQPDPPTEKLEDGTYPAKPTFTTVSHEDELPDDMDDPGHMDPPTAPEQERLPHPGQEPALGWSQTQQDLHDAYLAGTVAQRPEFSESQTVSVFTTNQFTAQLDNTEQYYYVYFYSDDRSTYLGHSLGVSYGESAEIPEEMAAPDKAPAIQYEYVFVKWVDEDGEPLDLSNLTSDVNAYAVYTTAPRRYNVTWEVGGGQVVQQWRYGEVPVYEGSTDRPCDDRYEYTFIAWDRQPSAVTGDVTYTAQYEKSDRRFKVTFDRKDGTDPIVKEFRYGQSLVDVVESLSKPYRAPDAQYTYTFKGWSDGNGNIYVNSSDFPALTSDVTFTATFDNTVNTYTITWVVEGVEIPSTWPYGEVPSFGENPPHKETDERHYYAFESWDTEPVAVTGDATYVASFTSTVRLYRVDFVVEGESYTLELEYEQMPVFEGTPKKDPDLQYEYTFVGWDNDPVPVRSDAIYVAEFGKIVRKYPVKFVVGNTELIAEYEYGTVPRYMGDVPTKPDDEVYCYKFTNWDKDLAVVDGNPVTYTACFEAIPLAPGADGENGKLTVQDGVYELVLGGTQADLSLIFDKAGKEQAASLEVMLGSAVLVFPKMQIDAFYLMGDGISSVSLVPSEHEGKVAYKLEMLDQSGAPVTYMVSDVTVRLPYAGVHSADVYRVESDGTLTKLETGHTDGYLTFTSMASATFVLKDKFRIGKNPSENGVFNVVGEAYAGEVVTIEPNPDEGYHVDEMVIEYGGQQIKLEPEDGKYSFVMPEGNVQITTTFKVVEGGTLIEVIVGVSTALLIVAIGFVITMVLRRRKNAKV